MINEMPAVTAPICSASVAGAPRTATLAPALAQAPTLAATATATAAASSNSSHYNSGAHRVSSPAWPRSSAMGPSSLVAAASSS